MTVGQLIEMVCGRLATEEGRIVDGTPFRGQTDAHVLGDMLQQCGLTRHACSRMTNGVTGEIMESLVFTGPCYYQKLKHMVIDKIHGRSRGPLNFLTRQPIEGRSRDGGLRVGEMERDCIVSHGASAVCCDRLFYCSDPFTMPLCRTCGLPCDGETQNVAVATRWTCRNCRERADTVEKQTPFAFKLLLQELLSLHIAPRMRLEDTPGESVEVSEADP